jgi:hypothetical protein
MCVSNFMFQTVRTLYPKYACVNTHTKNSELSEDEYQMFKCLFQKYCNFSQLTNTHKITKEIQHKYTEDITVVYNHNYFWFLSCRRS